MDRMIIKHADCKQVMAYFFESSAYYTFTPLPDNKYIFEYKSEGHTERLYKLLNKDAGETVNKELDTLENVYELAQIIGIKGLDSGTGDSADLRTLTIDIAGRMTALNSDYETIDWYEQISAYYDILNNENETLAKQREDNQYSER